jgi:hypothetical protein
LKKQVILGLVLLGLSGCSEAPKEKFAKVKVADDFEICINKNNFYYTKFDKQGVLLESAFAITMNSLDEVAQGNIRTPTKTATLKNEKRERRNVSKLIDDLYANDFKFKTDPSFPEYFFLERGKGRSTLDIYRSKVTEHQERKISAQWIKENLIGTCILRNQTPDLCSLYMWVDESRVRLVTNYEFIDRYDKLKTIVERKYIAPLNVCDVS